MYRHISRGVLILGVAALAVLVFGGMSYANNYGSGNYGACQYGSCGISLTTNGTVNLNITPVGGSTICTDQSDSAGVTTDSSTGYTLTLGDSDTNTNLAGASHGGNIAATSGTLASPVVLTANKWGYRVDSLGSFGSGPTSAGTNTAPLSLTFAGIQSSSNTPDTIATSSTAADPTVTTTVWYGACVDTTIPADSYSDTVTYTAVTN
jgi:hypothetical protein